MSKLYDIGNRGDELVNLTFCNHQWRSRFQHHEIVSTNLREHAAILE